MAQQLQFWQPEPDLLQVDRWLQWLSKELDPPFMMKPAPPLMSRSTGEPQSGHVSSLGSRMDCSHSNSPH